MPIFLWRSETEEIEKNVYFQPQSEGKQTPISKGELTKWIDEWMNEWMNKWMEWMNKHTFQKTLRIARVSLKIFFFYS
jgi:hypothetical protein